jgi:hypothetical protein
VTLYQYQYRHWLDLLWMGMHYQCHYLPVPPTDPICSHPGTLVDVDRSRIQQTMWQWGSGQWGSGAMGSGQWAVGSGQWPVVDWKPLPCANSLFLCNCTALPLRLPLCNPSIRIPFNRRSFCVISRASERIPNFRLGNAFTSHVNLKWSNACARYLPFGSAPM